MKLVLFTIGHTRIPRAHKLNILLHLIRLDIVKYDAMCVLATSKNLAEAAFDVLVERTALGRAVYNVFQRASHLSGLLVLSLAFLFAGLS